MAARVLLLLGVWCTLQAAVLGHLRFERPGKLGLQKQGPGLGALFGPASRMRMASDDSARLQGSNDMNNLLLSMVNQGAPPATAAAAADVTASVQLPAELSSMDGSYPLHTQQDLALPAATLDPIDPSMTQLISQYSTDMGYPAATASPSAAPDLSSYGLQLPDGAQSWDTSSMLDAQSNSSQPVAQYDLPPQFSMPPQVQLESAVTLDPLQVQQLQQQLAEQQQQQTAQQRLEEHQQLQKEQELLEQQQLAQQELDQQQQQQQMLVEEEQPLQEDLQQEDRPTIDPPETTQEFNTLFSAMLGSDSSSSYRSETEASSKPAPAIPTPAQQPKPAPVDTATSSSSSSSMPKSHVKSVSEQQRMPVATHAPVATGDSKQQLQQAAQQAPAPAPAPAVGSSSSSSSSSHEDDSSAAALSETVGFLPTPANPISSSSRGDDSTATTSSSSSSHAEAVTEYVTDSNDSAQLEFAAGASDQPGIEVDLIPTDPSDDLYVPNLGSARSGLEKVHNAADGLISTRHYTKSSAPLAVVLPQRQQPKLGVGAIVGIAAGGVMVVIVLAVFLARTVYHIRASQASKPSTDGSSAAGNDASSQNADGDTPRSTIDMQHFYTQYSVDLESGVEGAGYAAAAAAASSAAVSPTAVSSPDCHQWSHDGAGASAPAATADWWRVVKTRSSSNSSGKSSGVNSPMGAKRNSTTPRTKQNKGL